MEALFVLVQHPALPPLHLQRECFIDSLLDRIHLIVEMISVDRPCAVGS